MAASDTYPHVAADDGLITMVELLRDNDFRRAPAHIPAHIRVQIPAHICVVHAHTTAETTGRTSVVHPQTPA